MSKIDRVARGLFQGMKTQLNSQQIFHDVQLKVDNQTFKCHRFLLSSASRFFSGLFNSDMKDCKSDLVPIEGISMETFSAVYDFIYSGRIEITKENINDV